MGNRALTRAFANLTGKIPGLSNKVKEIILAAPDIDADIFKRDIAPVLAEEGCPITLYASSEDKALDASHIIHDYPRLGDTSNGVFVLPGVETIDATGIDTSFLGHSYIMNTQTILSDIYYLINEGLRAPKRMGLRAIETSDGYHYWAFYPGY